MTDDDPWDSWDQARTTCDRPRLDVLISADLPVCLSLCLSVCLAAPRHGLTQRSFSRVLTAAATTATVTANAFDVSGP